jgi:hypothetical protein
MGNEYQGKKDINVLALVKGNERYVFLYDDKNRADALRTLGRFASDPELSFSWYDAAVLSQKIRKEARKSEERDRNGNGRDKKLTDIVKRRFTLPSPDDNFEIDDFI